MKRPQFAHEKSHLRMIKAARQNAANVNQRRRYRENERKRDGNQSKNDLRLQNESESTYTTRTRMHGVCILGKGIDLISPKPYVVRSHVKQNWELLPA